MVRSTVSTPHPALSSVEEERESTRPTSNIEHPTSNIEHRTLLGRGEGERAAGATLRCPDLEFASFALFGKRQVKPGGSS